jgi:hypothetical protein
MTAPTPQPLTDAQAALVEQAQLRTAAQRIRLAEQREKAGKLQRTTA